MYYIFNSSLDSAAQEIILEAIDEIENKTCLRFQQQASNDHIEFTGEGDACLSTSVGKSKGKQLIRLPASSNSTCRTHGIVLHLICHALGMWHEHSRPDRDRYIDILEENIDPDQFMQHFSRRRAFEVEYYGQYYDYNSIMHYGKDYFSVNGNDTLRVADTLEYGCQGEAMLGQRSSLSVSDVIKLSQMYNCPGSGYGVPGHLKVHIRHGIALFDASITTNQRYIQVTAVDSSGKWSTYYTEIKQIYHHVTNWNKWIDFGPRKSWQYLEMSVWNYYRWSPDTQLTSNQTFTVSQGSHRNLQHCNGQSCTRRVDFDYILDPDLNDCNPNKCVHGTCTDQFFAHRCNCPQGYSGLQCEVVQGSLRVYIRYGSGLINRDYFDTSDPYAYLEAYDHEGNMKSLSTRTELNTLDPQWNQWLNFGEDSWSRVSVTIYDDDDYRSDVMSNTTSYYFPTHDSKIHVRKPCETGYVELDYFFQP